MIEIAYGLAQNIDNPDSRWLAVLPKVANAIGGAFTRERETVRASRQISQAVSNRARSDYPGMARPYH